jgi:hypothetical protein
LRHAGGRRPEASRRPAMSRYAIGSAEGDEVGLLASEPPVGTHIRRASTPHGALSALTEGGDATKDPAAAKAGEWEE